MSAQVPVLGGKGGGSGWGGDLSGFICQADTAAELWPRSWRNRRACVTCAGARLRKEGLSNKSRKSKITPVRINSGRGEIVKIRLVRQPFSCHSIMCRTVLLPARITRVRRKVPDLVG